MHGYRTYSVVVCVKRWRGVLTQLESEWGHVRQQLPWKLEPWWMSWPSPDGRCAKHQATAWHKRLQCFAMAYAYHASLGDDQTTIMFDQTKMREHLERSFGLGKLSFFPHSTGYKPKEMHFPLVWNRIVLFLSNARDKGWCGMLWILQRMVPQWCINLKSIPSSEEQWFCSACR